jgi:nicotinate-nucleotide--dimethylbenzimidazole phosphoribosyltransferase
VSTPDRGELPGDLDLPAVPPLDQRAKEAARRRWATRAEPPGALGRLEELAVHLAGVTARCPPPVVERPAVVVFAADHGVVADGASAWPAEVTAAMVATMAAGGAAISALARVVGARVTVVDVGVATPTAHLGGVLQRRVRPGTASIARGPAMTPAEARQAMAVGREMARRAIAAGADCLVGGEMGIGNTTPAAALISAVTGADPAAVVGPGAGLAADRLAGKRLLVERALARLAVPPDPVRPSAAPNPVRLLTELGGLEIAALVGFYVEAAAGRTPFVVDGVIAAAALCVADQLAPGTAARAVAGHRSAEPGATVALAHLGLRPLLDLGMRLGEGTGACLAVPLLQAACRALAAMADLPAVPIPPAISPKLGT